MATPTRISLTDLQDRHDFGASRAQVASAVAVALAEPEGLTRFMARWTSWNGMFGSAVAALAAKIGRSRGLFLDRHEPIQQFADRSVFVGSFFFDAARDEFDDRDTVHRDTHRCLAQATLAGLLRFQERTDTAAINALIADPPWLGDLRDGVARGYGAFSDDTSQNIFRAMGYHLGSEVLADEEFSMLDDALRTQAPELVAFLSETVIELVGRPHNAYQWIKVHSGHGGGVEADHFDWAVKGVRRGFQFSDPALHEDLKAAVFGGFADFARDHALFFERVGTA